MNIRTTKTSLKTRTGHFCVLAAICTTAVLAGCRNDAGTGALIGTGAGAGLGAIIGHQSGHGGEGALIGAGAGALGGYILGNESDKHKAEREYDPRYDY